MKRNHVAIAECVLAHYRYPIFRKLCSQKPPNPTYVLSSGGKIPIPSFRVIDEIQIGLLFEEGGRQLRFVKNFWLGKKILWQTGRIRLALSREFDTIIYVGIAYHLSTWISCALARLTGKRTLMWSHGFLQNEKGIKGWIRKRFYKLPNGMLLYGSRAKEIMIKKGFDPKKLYVIYNSLDYDKQCEIHEKVSEEQLDDLRTKLFSKPRLPVLMFIGRLTPQKKVDMILYAARLLKDEGTNCNILFIGDGEEKKNLQLLTDQLSLTENVCFYGACYEEEQIALLIMLSDICIAPGEVGLTAIHSLVYGTPVITHDNPNEQEPEYEAITSGLNGAFFKQNNVKDLAKKVELWLQKKLSKNDLRKAHFEVIEQHYNPNFQVIVINKAVQGIPAEETII